MIIKAVTAKKNGSASWQASRGLLEKGTFKIRNFGQKIFYFFLKTAKNDPVIYNVNVAQVNNIYLSFFLFFPNNSDDGYCGLQKAPMGKPRGLFFAL